MPFIFLLLFLCIQHVQNYAIFSLTDTYEWTIQNYNGTINKKLKNPTGIYSDLQKAGILTEDIFYRFNDMFYRWVGNDSWTYSVSFPNIENIENSSDKELIFHGLDGISTIYLNEVELGKTSNSFVRYSFDVSNILKEENNLTIKFVSPIKSSAERANASVHPVPPSCIPRDYNGECHVNFLRRMQASFAWDWGPAFPSVGIWKPIELLIRQNDLILRDVVVKTKIINDKWQVIIETFSEQSEKINNNISGTVYSTLKVTKNKVFSASIHFDMPSNTKKDIKISLTLEVPKADVEMWWPNEYGNQPLYNLSTVIEISNKNVTKKNINIGFRTVEVVQDFINDSVPLKGRSFYFRVNGIPIFAKGSNFIPSHVLPEKSANETIIRHLLESSKLTHMNMLRVWGGGLYESDLFYEICDELGIMIWQDFMFTCSLYPTDKDFLKSVAEEINQQARRLQYHPSIVIWAGNNENEAALRGDWYNSAENFTLFKEEYIQLYVDTIGKIVQSIDDSRTYLTSSPTNGIKTIEEGYVAKNPYDPLYGDTHYYNYLRNSWKVDNFPYTRFASEYGYQSLPSYTTWQEVASNLDLTTLDTEFMKHRQHLPLGYFYLILSLFFHFPLPLLTDLESIIYLTQINQAWSVKSQTEWYRKWKSTVLPDGQGQTMGALYWQLNDIWQAPSWASIEYGGKWKMLHYYAKHFFAPVLVTGDLDNNNTVTINLISDLLYDIPEAILKTEIIKYDSFIPVNSTSEIVSLEKSSAKCHCITSAQALFDSQSDCEVNGLKRRCFLKLSLWHKNETLISENFLFPHSFKISNGIQEANITTSVTTISTNECHIKLKTSSISLFVWLDVGKNVVLFNDNGFIMTQPEKEVLAFSPNIDCLSLQNSLNITVLDKKKLSQLASSVTELYLYSRFINPFQ